MTSGEVRRLWLRTDDGPDHLRALLDWLRHEDALRGRIRAESTRGAETDMGGALDALVVAMGSGGMGAVLAGSVSTWLSQRRSDVKITVTTESGRKVEVVSKRVDAHLLTADIERLLRDDEGDAQ